MGDRRFNSIDLFSGAGGMSLGFELAGVHVVAAVEYCSKAMKTHEHNFPDCINYNEDVCNVKTSSVLADLEQKEITKDDIKEIRRMIRVEIARIFFDLYRKKGVWTQV